MINYSKAFFVTHPHLLRLSDPEYIKPLPRGSAGLGDGNQRWRYPRGRGRVVWSHGREEGTAQTSVETTLYAATEVCVRGTVWVKREI